MPMIISSISAKGGTGKTTLSLALALAVHWNAAGRRVLLIDCDPLATLMKSFSLREIKGRVRAVAVGLASVEAHVRRGSRSGEWDVIIIDTPATHREIGPAIRVADVTIVLAQFRRADLSALKRLLSVCKKVGAEVVVIPNRCKSRRPEDKA